MKHLFVLTNLAQDPWTEHVPEDTQVLLTGQPFDDLVRVYVPLGYLAKSEDLAQKVGQYPNGRRWGRIIRNDGYHVEIETEDHEGEDLNVPANNPKV